MHVESAKPVTSGGWLHNVLTDLPRRVFSERAWIAKRQSAAKRVAIDWDALAEHMARGEEAAEARAKLAESLGLDYLALLALQVGVGKDLDGRPYWSFPSRNALGKVVGILKRYSDGRKLSIRGGRHALFYADGWEACNDVLILEGPTDVAAALGIGKQAVGRSSNVAGTEEIVRLVGDRRMHLRVIGENDRKANRCPDACYGCHVCWPGRHGMIQAVRIFRDALPNCLVSSYMPPRPIKDFRSLVMVRGPQATNRLVPNPVDES